MNALFVTTPPTDTIFKFNFFQFTLVYSFSSIYFITYIAPCNSTIIMVKLMNKH